MIDYEDTGTQTDCTARKINPRQEIRLEIFQIAVQQT